MFVVIAIGFFFFRKNWNSFIGPISSGIDIKNKQYWSEKVLLKNVKKYFFDFLEIEKKPYCSF